MKRIDMFIHFAEIAAAHNITVRFTTEPPSVAYWANPAERMISTRPIKNTGYYVSGLHEIGHIVGPFQSSKNSRLRQEWGAWMFAMSEAQIWTDTAQRIMVGAMTSYINSATPDQIRRMPESFHSIFGDA